MPEPTLTAPPSAPSAALTMILQARIVEKRVDATLGQLDMSVRRLGILGHLRASPGISFSALARRAGIKVQSLHPIVDVLVDLGFVSMVGGVGQGRAAVIELTGEGHRVLDRAREALIQVDDEIFADGEWKALGEALVDVAQAFFRARTAAAREAAPTP